MPPRAVLVPFVFLGVLASAPAHAEDVTQDLGVHFPGRLFLYAALIEGPGAWGMACRPMAEKALAAVGVLPVR